MKLGFLTAPFPETDRSSTWPTGPPRWISKCSRSPAGHKRPAPTRKYAGTAHIDVVNLTEAEPARSRRRSQPRAWTSPAWAYYPNPLHPDPETRRAAIEHLKAVIVATSQMGLALTNTFCGGDAARTVDANWQEALKVWPDIVSFAQDHGVKITFENCPMIFSDDEWPAGTTSPTRPTCGVASWRPGAAAWGSTTTPATWSG